VQPAILHSQPLGPSLSLFAFPISLSLSLSLSVSPSLWVAVCVCVCVCACVCVCVCVCVRACEPRPPLVGKRLDVTVGIDTIVWPLEIYPSCTQQCGLIDSLAIHGSGEWSTTSFTALVLGVQTAALRGTCPGVVLFLL
jgi:hypothetical protein